jgi:magnesium transporter
MARRKRSSKAGMPPGSLVYIGEREERCPAVTVIRFSAEGFESEAPDLSCPGPFVPPAPREGGVTWVQVRGLSKESVGALGAGLGIHPLHLEDALNTQQRPKMEDGGSYIYFAVRAWEKGPDGGLRPEQVSLFLGAGFVLSLEETEAPLFGPVEEALRSGKGRLRSSGADFLAYALLDLVVDGYFAVLEGFSDRAEELDDDLAERPSRDTLAGMHQLKKEVMALRRAAWPLRDALARLEKSDLPLLSRETRFYMRDVYDHAVQVIDSGENLRELLSEMTDVYLSAISNRLSEVMKFLTAVSTIFIPLTFITGFFGMNFREMYILDRPWGFPLVIAGCLALGVFMFVFFRTRKWL